MRNPSSGVPLVVISLALLAAGKTLKGSGAISSVQANIRKMMKARARRLRAQMKKGQTSVFRDEPGDSIPWLEVELLEQAAERLNTGKMAKIGPWELRLNPDGRWPVYRLLKLNIIHRPLMDRMIPAQYPGEQGLKNPKTGKRYTGDYTWWPWTEQPGLSKPEYLEMLAGEIESMIRSQQVFLTRKGHLPL